MTPRPALLEETAHVVRDVGPSAPVFLADLGFPCHLDCAPCRRQRRPSPRECVEGIHDLTRAAGALGPHPLRVVFFGGDPFARPNAFERLLVAVNGAARAAGVPFVAAAISDGTSWASTTVLRFFELGVRAYQVQLDGPACLHDLLRPLHGVTGSSFARVISSLKQRGRAEVVARVDPAFSEQDRAHLLATLEEEGLFEGENPVRLLVSPPGPYPREARELARVLDALHRWDDDASHLEHSALFG